MVLIGVDPHKGSHTAVVVDGDEHELGRLTVRADRRQLDRLLTFASPFGDRTWAIESAGGLGFLLAQQLVSSIYRALVRHRVIDPTKRRRRRADYRRWERGRSMELWQMDVVGRVLLADGAELKVVTGIDDHSRFVVCAAVVARATARPVCEALSAALGRHGVPEQILTDNGKVFTARFGLGPGPVMFDRICAENGIRHLLTAPYSPTTTGKVERLHKTMRAEFFTDHQREFATIGQLQAALDAWVVEYNTERPHQSCGGRPPAERFALAERSHRRGRRRRAAGAASRASDGAGRPG